MDDPVLSEEPDFDFQCPGIDAMYPGSLAFGGNTAPQHHTPSTILNSGDQVFFQYGHPIYTKPTLSICCQRAQFLFHLTIEHGYSNIKQTPGAYVCG